MPVPPPNLMSQSMLDACVRTVIELTSNHTDEVLHSEELVGAEVVSLGHDLVDSRRGFELVVVSFLSGLIWGLKADLRWKRREIELSGKKWL